MPCSMSSDAARGDDVDAVGRAQRGGRGRLVVRLDDLPAADAVQELPGRGTEGGQPLPHPVRARGQVLADRHHEAHPAGDVRLPGLEGPHRRHALRLGQDRRQPGGDRRPRAEEPDAARPGQPLAGGAVDDVGPQVGVGVPERLGGVEHERDAGLPAQRRDLRGGLQHAAVARDVGEVHEGRRVVGEQARDPVHVGAAEAVDRQRLGPQAVGAQLGDVRRVLAGQARHPRARRQPPAGEQRDQRRLGRLDERDVGGGHPDQAPEHRAALLQQVVRRRLGHVAAQLGLVPRVVRRRLQHAVALPAHGRAVQVPAGRARPRLAPGRGQVLVRQQGVVVRGAHGRTLGDNTPEQDARTQLSSSPRATETPEWVGTPSSGSTETSTIGNWVRSRSAGSSNSCVPGCTIPSGTMPTTAESISQSS